MSNKKILRSVAGVAVLLVAVGSVVAALRREAEARQEARAVATSTPLPAAADAVTVYYFHGETRCDTCREIEARTARALERRFAEELGDGRLRFEVVDFERPDGLHYRDRYDLAFGTVVVQGAGDAAPWESLADVWSLVHGDEPAFEAYVAQHVRSALERPR